MNFRLTHPEWLWVLPFAIAWIVWLTMKSDVSVSSWRRWSAFAVRLVVTSALILALAGLQWLRPIEGMNVIFALDRSDSVPSSQQDAALRYVNAVSQRKDSEDKAGLIVFGSDAGIEFSPNAAVDHERIDTVVETERTDLASAIRLATAAFPEMGQKRIVLMSDGNENIGDAYSATLAATPLGVSVDVLPLGVSKAKDVSVQRLNLPNNLKKGQTFEVKIYAEADQPQAGTVRLYRNEQFLGQQEVRLNAGKNLFTFPQTLTEPGFYSYEVALEGRDDLMPQNNRAAAFTSVRGDPRVLLVSSDPESDGDLAEAIRSVQIDLSATDVSGFPASLAEIQSYDAIFLSNVAAGDLGRDLMRMLESAVRDFGIGLVCIGGDQAYAAGGYRNTPLETTLPVDMELSSKKVLPNGALVLIMHGMEFNNGNQVARDIAIAALDALGPQDEIGVVLWDGTERWLFPLTKAQDKREIGRQIAGMNQGDLPSFQNVLTMAHEGLVKSSSHLKHIIVFSDGDPGAPSSELMQSIVEDKITVSTILIAGHAGPSTMISIADQGRGRFYDVSSPAQLPQVFIKEAAVILKSAIFEEAFQPQLVHASEAIRGIGAQEYPQLLGYVASTPKSRAEVPLVSEKGDPVLAHWQFGLGRAVAFTSDAKPKWAQQWLGWDKFRQFWSQIAQWSLRRLDSSDFTAEVAIEKGIGQISVEALDPEGNFRNFLNLQATVVSPKGEPQLIQLEQTGPGHYEAKFPTREVGAYIVHIRDIENGEIRAAQVVGASVNYSPEFDATEPNTPLLRRLADSSGGKVLDLQNLGANPFLHDRRKTFQPQDLWEWLVKLAIILFPLDVGLRRVQIDRAEWLRATENLRRWIFFWRGKPRSVEADEGMAALLARRNEIRARQSAPAEANPELFRPKETASVIGDDFKTGVAGAAKPAAQQPAESQPQAESPDTTSRLLEAKRRAQQRKKPR